MKNSCPMITCMVQPTGMVYGFPVGPCYCCRPQRPQNAKPQITIMAGDDTGVMGLNPITIGLKTELDIEGCTFVFSFLGFEQRFTDLQKDDEGIVNMTVNMTAAQTAKFPLGLQYATVWIEDEEGKRFTLTDDILVLVTIDADEAKSGNTIVIEIHGGGGASTLLNGVSWSEGGSIGSLREFLAKVGRALGADITE